jgi:hypothetical protein
MTRPIPTTTQPGPDQARLAELIRFLAEIESPDAPVVSVYVDVSPERHGDAPARRPDRLIVRDRLREITDSYHAHAPGRDSLEADAQKIHELLEDGDLDGVDGLAIFACTAAGLWELVPASTRFETQVSAGPTADLFQLAALLEEFESSVLAVVDTNTCRLFVTRRGALDERAGPDEPPDEHRRHAQGGWSQARYQRHIDMQDKRFAREAAEAIERLVDAVNATHLILAGDERALTAIQAELSPRLASMVEQLEHIGMRRTARDIAAEAEPILAAVREADESEVADRVIAGVRAGELGVAGVNGVADALEKGQVHELVIDRSAPVDEELRSELVRLAALTSADVIVVDGHQALLGLGGVGAALRYRISPNR